MKKVYIIIFIVCTASCVAQVKLKHGLLLGGGGKSYVSGTDYYVPEDIWINLNTLENSDEYFAIAGLTTVKYNFMIGYKFRIKPARKKHFYDADLSWGYRSGDIHIVTENKEPVYPSGGIMSFNGSREFSHGFLSLSMTYNYQTYKGLHVGAGLSPEYYHWMGGSYGNSTVNDRNKIDVPVIIKFGYELKFIDLSFSYKFGVTSIIDRDIARNGRINEWRLQLFIPF